MKLSALMFKQIIESLKSDEAASRGHEKRTQGRVGLRCMLDIVPCEFADSGMKTISVWVRDISVNGIGLVSNVQIAEGLMFAGRFARDSGEPLSILYRVVYCRRLPGDLYSVGGHLEKVMSAGDPKKSKPVAKPVAKPTAA